MLPGVLVVALRLAGSEGLHSVTVGGKSRSKSPEEVNILKIGLKNKISHLIKKSC